MYIYEMCLSSEKQVFWFIFSLSKQNVANGGISDV